MRITFANTETIERSTVQAEKAKTLTGNRSGAAAAYYNQQDALGTSVGIVGKDKGKSLLELQQDAEHADVGIQQDYMTLMSHTMSEEDYAKLEEEGFSFSSMEPEEAVTIVDKIKAELVRSGKEVAGYTDDLDMETLSNALGSATLAQKISSRMEEMDVPCTVENLESLSRAWNVATQLRAPGEGQLGYLMEQGMEPEIWNLYLAQNSGAGKLVGSRSQYYAEEIPGYYVKTSTEVPADFQGQVDQLLEEAGRESNQDNREKGTWLLEHGIPLEEETLQQLETLRSLAIPVTEEDFARAAVIALAEGKDALHGDLGREESIYQKAVRVLAEYSTGEYTGVDPAVAAGNLQTRRQLEEIRLRMTAEINVKLLKSGFSIDTAPVEELIAALRQAEQEVAARYFPGESNAVERYQLMERTNRVVAELPGLPIQTLGQSRILQGSETLTEFYQEGKQLQDNLQKAKESYETLMTSPRRDLGDRIEKAFVNVDELLQEMGWEPAEENRRAVRILGYNRMELTEQNLTAVMAADEQVRTVIEKMTPASVLKMIRDGVNPLEQTLPQLEEYLDQQPQNYEQQADSYSRFLYGLEQNHEITPEERDSYIGIYRLLHQVESRDGAAIGAVLQSGAELQFANLLTGARSGRFKGMDQRVSDRIGEVVDRIQKGETIPEQIGKAFRKEVSSYLTDVSGGERTDRAYQKESYIQQRAVLETEAEVTAMLNKAQIPMEAGFLVAGQTLLKEGIDRREYLEKEAKQPQTILEHMDGAEEFQETCREQITEWKQEVEESTLEATESLDVKELQLLHKQLTIAGALTSSEEYFVPLYVGEELCRVHLTFERGDAEEKGNIEILLHLPDGQQRRASLRYAEGHISGYCMGNGDGEVTKLDEDADIFHELKKEGALEKGDRNTLYRIAKTFLEGQMT